MNERNGLHRWLTDNAWGIIVATVGIILVFAAIQAKVTANAQEIEEMRIKVNNLQSLVERIIVLEEHDKTITDDINEIKLDIKDIKKGLNIN